jgi:Reverse transcriptase (RNA-dependent DNA polymerase)
LKARLVAGGDQQNKNLYDDLSAPTVSTAAVFTVLSIAAHEGRHAAVVDIGSAFLNAEMKTGVDVHMRLDRTMSELMTRLRPSYAKYMDSKGCVTVLLDRALYGCVESAALWYDNLRDTMLSLGYHRNPYEICVFNRTDDSGTQCTVTEHVDDLFIVSASLDVIDHLTDGLKKRYREITKTQGTVLNYLGMTFDLSQRCRARVSMKGYVDEVLASCDTTGGPGPQLQMDYSKCVRELIWLRRQRGCTFMVWWPNYCIWLRRRDQISYLSYRILLPESADAPKTTSSS